MNILEIDFGETYLIFIIDDVLDSIFMIQDHLCLYLCFSLCRGIILDEDLCIQIAIGIPFEFR